MHDLYESDDDDFCCGRAWGASRVAIVSGARYQPILDVVHAVDRQHVWPASHCRTFVETLSQSNLKKQSEKPKHVRGGTAHLYASPLSKALEAHRATYTTTSWSETGLQNTFLFRLCRTVSHELGHCFGLDHCMYKACVMQGTASVAEDMRQPPYLCPVCEAKLAWAIFSSKESGNDGRARAPGKTSNKKTALKQSQGKQSEDCELDLAKWKRARHAAIKRFCDSHGGAFAPLAAWSKAFLDEPASQEQDIDQERTSAAGSV